MWRAIFSDDGWTVAAINITATWQELARAIGVNLSDCTREFSWDHAGWIRAYSIADGLGLLRLDRRQLTDNGRHRVENMRGKLREWGERERRRLGFNRALCARNADVLEVLLTEMTLASAA